MGTVDARSHIKDARYLFRRFRIFGSSKAAGHVRTNADVPLRSRRDSREVAKELNRDSLEDVTELANRVSWFHDAIKVHEKTEEEILFPALEARYKFVAETYRFDHDDSDEHVFADMNRAFAGLKRGAGNGGLRDNAHVLHRQTFVLNEHMRLHITKENELLITKIESEFDIDEQVQIAGAMAGMIDPPFMGELVAWVYKGQGNADREGTIRFLMNVLPPEAFAGLSGMLAGIDASAWTDMQSRIPELTN